MPTYPLLDYPVPQQPVSPNYDPNAASDQVSAIANRAIPGFNGLTSQSTGIVNNLMGGLPSAAPAQRANAYFGVGSGMPNSDFVRNRGYDLYGQQSEQYKQRGFDDFLKLLGGYSGAFIPNIGQQQQGGQFTQDLQQRQQAANTGIGEFNANYNDKAPGRLPPTSANWTEDASGNSPLFGPGSNKPRRFF